MRFVILAVAFVAMATGSASAQLSGTGPLTSNAKVIWFAPSNIASAADAQTWEPRLKRDGVPMTALTNVACSPVQGAIECQAPLSQANIDALNMAGRFSLTLTVFKAGIGESGESAPFVLTSPAVAPTGLRLER